MNRLSMLLVVVVVGAGVLLPAVPAQAGYSGVFECDTIYNGPWPGSGGSNPCSGFTVGAMTNPTDTCGTLSASAPPVFVRFDGCSFEMSISYNDPCIGILPPPLGTFSGQINVDGGRQSASYNALRVGLKVLFVPIAPGRVLGEAVWIPHPPLPTCAAPGPLWVTMVGEVFWA